MKSSKETLALAALLLLGALLGAGVARLASGEVLAALDEGVAHWLQRRGTPPLTVFLLWVTRVHSHLAVSIFAAFFAVFLARRGQWRWVWTVVLVMPGGLALNALLKQVFQRARPVLDDPVLMLASYSFPSGHTAAATLLYGLLAAYVASRVSAWGTRLRIVVCAVLMVAIVGFSRIYLGVHYLSDVLAAAAASTAWLALCLTVLHARPLPRHH